MNRPNAAAGAAPVRPLPEITFPEALPVSAGRDEIAEAVREHQVVIVCGETGSGKTTQLPKLMLALGLDEPTEGLAPLIVRDLEQQILMLKAAGISILLSEQNVKSALKLSNRVYVIDNGRIRFGGTVADFEADEETKKKYLMV